MSFLPRGRADQPRGGDSTGGGDELGAIRRYPTDQNRGAMARNKKKTVFVYVYMIKAYQTLSLSQSCLIHLMISI